MQFLSFFGSTWIVCIGVFQCFGGEFGLSRACFYYTFVYTGYIRNTLVSWGFQSQRFSGNSMWYRYGGCETQNLQGNRFTFLVRSYEFLGLGRGGGEIEVQSGAMSRLKLYSWFFLRIRRLGRRRVDVLVVFLVGLGNIVYYFGVQVIFLSFVFLQSFSGIFIRRIYFSVFELLSFWFYVRFSGQEG